MTNPGSPGACRTSVEGSRSNGKPQRKQKGEPGWILALHRGHPGGSQRGRSAWSPTGPAAGISLEAESSRRLAPHLKQKRLSGVLWLPQRGHLTLCGYLFPQSGQKFDPSGPVRPQRSHSISVPALGHSPAGCRGAINHGSGHDRRRVSHRPRSCRLRAYHLGSRAANETPRHDGWWVARPARLCGRAGNRGGRPCTWPVSV